MTARHQNPRILVVTPEVTFVRYGRGPGARYISARAGGLGDICTAQTHGLYENGLDVHLALPNYHNVFKINTHRISGIDIHNRQCELPESHIHLDMLTSGVFAAGLANTFNQTFLNMLTDE